MTSDRVAAMSRAAQRALPILAALLALAWAAMAAIAALLPLVTAPHLAPTRWLPMG
jgi:hypothetical protein